MHQPFDLHENMGRGYKAYSSDPGILDQFASIGDDFIRVRGGEKQGFVPADLMVLAIDALQITMGKEEIDDSLIPAKHGFFSFVNTDGAD